MRRRPALLAIAAAGGLALGSCARNDSDITIAYRGDVAAYRQLVRVVLDTGRRARTVTPAFPSAARPAPIGTRGTLPITVIMLSANDTIARYSPPPLAVAPGTSYVLSVIVSARAPSETRCTGHWVATPIVPRGATPGGSSATAGKLYVSVTHGKRGEEPPDCAE